ncbi:hypothetical protein A2U01_0016063, partial [Trifolium medium]|nr:hypothetical protein [Trifolium medium]
HDDRSWPNHLSRDHDPVRRNQSRYSRERHRACRRSRSLHRRRSCSTFSNHGRRMAAGLQFGRWQSKDGRSRQEVFDQWQMQSLEFNHRKLDYRHRNSVKEQAAYRNRLCVEEQEDSGQGSGRVNDGRRGSDKLGTELKRYVSFYFTNFPCQLSNLYLRKGFEVCGMLEDVFVPKKRNKRGEPFGFVKFSNVRDVTKLLSALNNVHFGHYRVRARVASFNRNDMMAGQRLETERFGLTKGNDKPVMKEGNVIDPRTTTLKGNGVRNESTGTKTNIGVVNDVDTVMGGFGDPEAVREGGSTPRVSALPDAAIKEKDRQVLMRSYKTEPDDVLWAQNGIVATMINGEAVPVVQSRITDD